MSSRLVVLRRRNTVCSDHHSPEEHVTQAGLHRSVDVGKPSRGFCLAQWLASSAIADPEPVSTISRRPLLIMPVLIPAVGKDGFFYLQTHIALENNREETGIRGP